MHKATKHNPPLVHASMKMKVHSFADMKKVMDGDSSMEDKRTEKVEGD